MQLDKNLLEKTQWPFTVLQYKSRAVKSDSKIGGAAAHFTKWLPLGLFTPFSDGFQTNFYLSGIPKHVDYGGTRVKKYYLFIELFIWVPISVFQLKIYCVFEHMLLSHDLIWTSATLLVHVYLIFTMIYVFLIMFSNKLEMNKLVTKDLGGEKINLLVLPDVLNPIVCQQQATERSGGSDPIFFFFLKLGKIEAAIPRTN